MLDIGNKVTIWCLSFLIISETLNLHTSCQYRWAQQEPCLPPYVPHANPPNTPNHTIPDHTILNYTITRTIRRRGSPPYLQLIVLLPLLAAACEHSKWWTTWCISFLTNCTHAAVSNGNSEKEEQQARVEYEIEMRIVD